MRFARPVCPPGRSPTCARCHRRFCQGSRSGARPRSSANAHRALACAAAPHASASCRAGIPPDASCHPHRSCPWAAGRCTGTHGTWRGVYRVPSCWRNRIREDGPKLR
eukprot:3512210-Prymnesium_polylepis.1